ncbi:AarF/ABC1/UbiB kinase family protein [Vibrio sp. S4M6]|uniref:ABC1 kinase family protein n=1 Tax=Vibrio sinus TaxID=2946865 RepID=UPI00202A24F2|nr:AarF/ABC1/UbiB kinase family protein [Vibrio sinus]MCL9782387.1 AarF/ABC1/UbiB kinase family protein [Vibrio sinus]
MAREVPVPKNRASRLLKVGRLLGEVAVQVISDGASALAAGKLPKKNDLLLTPANAMRLADRLSEMRGAAMKVGQLLSMETGDYLPPVLTEILATLRENARPMPQEQVVQVLQGAWGKRWQDDFKQFSFTHLAAASIGQVHEATTKDGRHLAIKVQYPGIQKSIDSDIDNVAALFNIFRLIPKDYDITTMLSEAKQQLRQEADYCAEADCIAEYRRCIGDDDAFELPAVDRSRTTCDVLTMSFVTGAPIEALVNVPSEVRNRVATRLLSLVMREVFEWGLVQTDAQFGNYRYQEEHDRIGLLDFGATRHYSNDMVDAFRRLMKAATKNDTSAIESTAVEMGYLRKDESITYRRGLCEMIIAVAEPVRYQGKFDFATSDLSRRVMELAISLRLNQRYMHLPPTDILFLHRKIAGTYLLCARLRAQVNVNHLVAPYIQ